MFFPTPGLTYSFSYGAFDEKVLIFFEIKFIIVCSYD